MKATPCICSQITALTPAGTLKVSVNGIEIPVTGELITDINMVDDIVRKFKCKHVEVKRYYTKFDVAIEVTL